MLLLNLRFWIERDSRRVSLQVAELFMNGKTKEILLQTVLAFFFFLLFFLVLPPFLFSGMSIFSSHFYTVRETLQLLLSVFKAIKLLQ
jgi:hypothetical protein